MLRSSATAIVSATVRAGNSRPSWNDRPSPSRARGVGAEPADGGPVELDVALARGLEPGQHVEEGGLARAVRAQEAEDLAGPHVEGDVVEGGDATEVLRHAVDAHPQVALAVGAVGAERPDEGATAGTSPLTWTTAGAPTPSSTDAAPSRKTERSTSGRSSSSLVGPWNRISPFSMKYAVSATVSATLTDCSTRITVVPCSLSRCTATSSSATMLGARPSESSSIISSRGRSSSAMARVSICCWPPLRLAAGSCMRSTRAGNISSALATRRGPTGPRHGRASPPAAGSPRRSATGTRPGRPGP